MKRQTGFTLVELLVVIGIIALLIGILLPTLSMAREQAKLVNCLSNMRQFGMGNSFYVNEWNGSITPGFRNDDHPKPDWTYYFTNQNASGFDGPGANIGRMIQLEYLEVGKFNVGNSPEARRTWPRIVWCPGLPASTLFFNSGEGMFGAARPRQGYFWNPHWAWRNENKTARMKWYHKAVRFPEDKALATDIVYGVGEINHLSSDKAKWNVLFIDGHVTSAESRDMLKRVERAGNNLNNWNHTDSYVDVLQNIASGKDPRRPEFDDGYGWNGERVEHPVNP